MGVEKGRFSEYQRAALIQLYIRRCLDKWSMEQLEKEWAYLVEEVWLADWDDEELSELINELSED